ncbi:hypothetical protein J6TS1_25050 [Siminovitchia terrae]|uniref:DUF1700 domain-containing protein n=1 Tax=Siminovitchia terrae TaxID=1914933 RepID=A0A429X6M8_SIMTE|nr:DUF1700 domain-containing protein [Siminovitchia terrae]RST59039.1 DUF1700 domain-containing protein [Siminovitchia terrae]GIN92330.1 hypothetical protein J22TS1_33810 [Siminovitchia terrae]GIN96635.1 hypothetical protein J6TS1_25050 [Siminovitchia terrae]
MTKYQFMRILESSLEKLSEEERKDILQDFEEHFILGKEEGKTEEEISASLGSPQQIAKDLLVNHHLEKVETTKTTGNVFRAVWAVIGLSFFNLVFVLGPFIGLIGAIVGGWVSGMAFIVSPLLVLVSAIIFPEAFQWFDMFFSFILSGIGFFIVIGMYFATRGIINGFVRYLKFNTRLVKGGLKHD